MPQSTDSAQSHCLCAARLDTIEDDGLPTWANDLSNQAWSVVQQLDSATQATGDLNASCVSPAFIQHRPRCALQLRLTVRFDLSDRNPSPMLRADQHGQDYASQTRARDIYLIHLNDSSLAKASEMSRPMDMHSQQQLLSNY